MNTFNTLRRLLLGLILFSLPVGIQAQTKLIVEFFDLSTTEHIIPEDGGFHFENGYLIIDDDSEQNTSFLILTIRKISLQEVEITNIPEIDASPASVYPNPATDYIIICTGTDKEEIVSIYSPAGMMYLQCLCRTGEPVDISSLPPGFYILCVNNQSLKFCKL